MRGRRALGHPDGRWIAATELVSPRKHHTTGGERPSIAGVIDRHAPANVCGLDFAHFEARTATTEGGLV